MSRIPLPRPPTRLRRPPTVALLPASAIADAARRLLPHLEQGRRVDAAILRAAMETAFGASDASGAWDWKIAYDACEAATVLFLRKYGKALFRKAGSPAARAVRCWRRSPACCRRTRADPRKARRSSNSRRRSRSGLAALTAAAITPADRVLEPSAGTGLLAILAEIGRRQRSSSTNWPRPAPGCSSPLSGRCRHPFRRRADRRSSRRRRSCRPSC